MNKKAEPLALGWMISVIILAGFLFIVFLMILGVIPGPQEWFKNIVGGGENIEAVSNGCKSACAGQLEYDYCTRLRKVVFDKDKKNPDNRQWTCDELAKSGKATGLMPCDSIVCEQKVTVNP